MQISGVHLGYIILLFIVACSGMVLYKKLSTPFKVLAWSAIMVFLTSVLDEFFIIKYHTNAPAFQISCIEEYIFYATVYYHLFKARVMKNFIVISIILMAIFFTFNAIFIQPFIHKFPTNINTPAQVLNAAFALLLFKEMLDYPAKMNVIKQPIFWFNTAMLFYATTMFFMLSLSNYISEHSEDMIVTHLWWFIDYAFQLLIGIAFLTYNKEPFSEESPSATVF